MKRYEGMVDDDLVHLYAAGCNEAFNELLMRYDAYVHTYIRYSISDEDQVEDVFQEVFIKVMLTIRQGRYTAEGKFKSWLGRVAHNLVIDHFRRQKARGTSQPIESNDPEQPLQTLQVPSSDLSAEEAIIFREHLTDLSEGIRNLSQEQQEVVRLRYWEDMSFKEIAEQTGVSINTALGRMRYALAHLKRHMCS
jgi:RNA polymerase sigma factor, sigma-70 family